MLQPLIVFSLSSPSVLWTMGSRRIFSSCCPSSSSLDAVAIVSPVLLITVTAEICCRVVAGSAGGRSKVALPVVTFVCFGVLPKSSGRVLLGGVNAGADDGAGVGKLVRGVRMLVTLPVVRPKLSCALLPVGLHFCFQMSRLL